jgi:hypothetical protein
LLIFPKGPARLNSPENMAKRKFHIGDKVRVIGMSKITFCTRRKGRIGHRRFV